MIFNSVNQHFLARITELSGTHALEASNNIVDDQGYKLWAQGSNISGELLDKLLQRKLARPLEATITVEDAIDSLAFINDCRAFLEGNPLFSRIVTPQAIHSIAGLKNVYLPDSMRLLLTAAKVTHPHSYERALATTLVIAGLTTTLGAADDEVHRALVAAMLHDLGELYVAPALLKRAYRLDPHEWKNVANHPRIGQLLVHELTALPPSIGVSIALHHERLDGSGYPSQVDGSKPNMLGNWLAVADSVAAIMSRGDTGAAKRAALALRIVPEEFDQDAVNVILHAINRNDDSLVDLDHAAELTHAKETSNRLLAAENFAKAISEHASDVFIKETAIAAEKLLANLSKSLRATGIVEIESYGPDALDAETVGEVNVIVREIQWRMRSLARNTQLRVENHAGAFCLPIFESLIAELNASA